MGTTKQSKATKLQWSKLDITKRRKRMKKLTDNRWVGVSKKKRKLHAIKMAEARWGTKII